MSMISTRLWPISLPKVFNSWASPPSEPPAPMQGRRGFIFFRHGACSLSWSVIRTGRDTKKTLPPGCGIRQSPRSDERNWSRGLKGLPENWNLHSVPQGRLNLAQDASPGLDLKRRPSPVGTAENTPRPNPGHPSAVPAGLNSQILVLTHGLEPVRTFPVLGDDFSQPRRPDPIDCIIETRTGPTWGRLSLL